MKKLWQLALYSNGTHYQRIQSAPGDIWIIPATQDELRSYAPITPGSWVSPGFFFGSDHWVVAQLDLKGWKS